MDVPMNTSSATTAQSITQISPVTSIIYFPCFLSVPLKLAFLDKLPPDPATWSETDVATWLNNCGLIQYASVFQGIVILKIVATGLIQSIYVSVRK
jgi:hypothetical protein